jgi:ribosomal protein S3AE
MWCSSTADNHRLGFRVVDVGGDNGPTGCHFVTHKFRRDVFRQTSAKAFARMLVA